MSCKSVGVCEIELVDGRPRLVRADQHIHVTPELVEQMGNPGGYGRVLYFGDVSYLLGMFDPDLHAYCAERICAWV